MISYENKSYNNIHTIIKNQKIIKYNENKKKKKKKSYLNIVAGEVEKKKKIHKVC